MSELLFLAHRMPYPPDKGDKIRSFHLLRHFAADRPVHLGCFFDDPRDERHVAELEQLCTGVAALPLRSPVARARSAAALLTGAPLSLPYYGAGAMHRWVRRTLECRDISTIIAYSSPMAQYALGPAFERYRRIMDFVDVDSDKWRQYANRSRWPMSWIYAREARRLAEFERRVASQFDASVFVSANEVRLFDTISPETTAKHHAVGNGVATEYFDPDQEFAKPYPGDSLPIVFTGMMNYWANVDAVSWFARDVFPEIRAREPRAGFWIVGAAPTGAVRELAQLEGVEVTGRVADVRPWLQHAALAVAPLRIARGVQNKVLEALAMGCRVLCSPQAAAGLDDVASAPLTVAESPADTAAAACSLLAVDSTQSRDAARRYVLEHYGWERRLRRFTEIEAALAARS
jgi:sugar transferase (PEP-CTERM/EpsH1 system associated)